MKQGQRITRRIITLVLTAAMLFGLVCTPIGQVRASAAEAPMDDAPTTIAAASGPMVTPNDQGTYNVTFSFQWEAEKVEVRGTLPGVGWGDNDGRQMTCGQDNVWTTTFENVPPGTYQYKFVANGDSWKQDPKNSYTSGDDGNSFVAVGYSNPVIDETCVTIKFIATNDETTVRIAGTFGNNGWNPVDMQSEGGGVYTYAFPRSEPDTFSYKIVTVNTKEDGSEEIHWVADPANPVIAADGNSQLTVDPLPEPTPTPTPEATPTPEPVDPNNFVSPEIHGNQVTFHYYSQDAVNAEGVWLAGSMTGWYDPKDDQTIPMVKDANGVWSRTLSLSDGGYEYKYLVGSKNGWTPDPKNLNPIDNNANSMVLVGYQSPVVNGSSVTFNYYNASVGARTVKVAGSMTDWLGSPEPMKPVGNGLYTCTINNLQEDTYEYKFIIEDTSGKITWLHDPLNPEALIGNNNDNNQFTINESAPEESQPTSPDPDPTESPTTTPELDPELTEHTFRYEDPDASNVWLTGTMTSWNPEPMHKDESTGAWSITMDLTKGAHQYKFLVNTTNGWTQDLSNPHTGSNDGNSFIAIGYESPIIVGGEVTIQYIGMNGDETVEIAGEIPGIDWGSPVTMHRNEDGVYSYSFTGIPNGTYKYKLIVTDNTDSHWVGDPANENVLRDDNNNTVFTVTDSTAPDPDASTTPEPQKIISPEVKGHDITLRYQDASAESVGLLGTIPGTSWTEGEALPLSKKSEDIWEITLHDVPAGKYEYKFYVNNEWKSDPLNPWVEGDFNNSIVVITGLVPPESQTVKTGSSLTLPVKLQLFDEDGNSSEVEVAFSLNGNYEGVSLENGALTVPETFVGTSISLTATHNGETVDFTVNVVTQLYTYNIYYFDWTASRMDINASELWLWHEGKTGSAYPFTSTERIGDKTWLKATVQFPVTQLGVIVRSKGDWDWKTEPDYELSNTEDKESCNAYVVFGQGLTMDTPPELPKEQGRDFYVPGTFPGNSWDAASNKMTVSDKGDHIYSYTFKDVPPATYEFKISVNGSWDENYGAEGKESGGNYSVTVPTQMDVTVYYSDVSHCAVTDVNYKFVTPTVGGLGESIVLSDAGLTGVYSGKATLQAGEYSDLSLLVDGVNVGLFAPFKLEQPKEVTFYYAPGTNVWYCDAMAWDGATEAFFDSKDLTYKNPFGAVPTDTPVTFSIDATSNVTTVTLVVGSQSFNMEMVGECANGKQRWSTTASFPSIGELDYYFILQAGGIKVYCDDDGYYGTGMITELTSVKPYDLVVYDKAYKTPDWMKDAVIYQIFPDRFFNADPSNDQAQTSARGAVDYEFPAWHMIPENPDQKGLGQSQYENYGAFWGDGQWSNEIYGGDLKGITEKVNYLRDLGVTVIYLNPVFASISNHRYDTSDYTEIDPILGDLEDFRELVKAAYANGMHIILDGVFNHVSDDSIYFDRYYKYLDAGTTKIGAYPYWAYVYDYMKDHGVQQPEAEKAAEEYFRTEYHITDFSYTTWFDISSKTGTGIDTIGHRIGKPVYTYQGWWGYDSMPVIKSTNGSEFQTKDWAEDVITSEDSITRYWLEQGSNGWRLDVANEVSDETWQNFREVVKDTGDCVIIGEIWDDATKYLMGDMYDSVMNYMFRNAVTAFAKGGTAEQATKDLEKIRERYPSEAFYAMMNLVDSHDTARILSFLDGINDDRIQKDPEHTFPQYETTSEVAKERQKLVAFLQFTYAGAPTIYYGDERGIVGADDPDDRRTIADWDSVTDPSLLAWYTQLGNLRADYSALRTGSVEPIDNLGSTVLGFVRRDAAQSIIVLANNAGTEQTVYLDLADLGMDETALQELISGSTVSVDNGTITVTVPAYRGIVLTGDAANPQPLEPIPVPDYEAMDKEKEEESKPPVDPDPSESDSSEESKPPVESNPPVTTPEPSDEPTTSPTTEPSQEPAEPTQAPTTPPTTEPQDPTTPPTTEPTEEPSQTPSEEPETPPATEDPAPPATQQPAPPTYYPQPSEPTTSTAPVPSDTPASSTAPAASTSPSPSPSAPVEDLPDIDAPLAGLPILETTIRPNSSMVDGVLTAEIQDSLQDAILDHVEANKSTTVVVAPAFDEKSAHNDVILPGALLDSLSDVGNVDVRVETPVGNVTIPEAALEQLGTAKQVSVCVQKSEDSVTVNVKVDGKTLATVPGGVKTALQLEDGQVAVLVDKSGKETVLPKSIVEDGTAYAILPGSGTVKVVSRTALFQDVPATSWYADAVSFAATHEIFAGVSESEMLFAPDLAVDRSMAATMLWALESKVNPKTAASFPDVAADKWYAASVAWASENGIVAGYSTGEFAPADTITREQFATMLYNYAKYLGLDTSRSSRMQTFSDADTVSAWAKDAMAWAVGKGIINGNGNQQLVPKDSITRAQAAAAMKNLVSLIVK